MAYQATSCSKPLLNNLKTNKKKIIEFAHLEVKKKVCTQLGKKKEIWFKLVDFTVWIQDPVAELSLCGVVLKLCSGEIILRACL